MNVGGRRAGPDKSPPQIERLSGRRTFTWALGVRGSISGPLCPLFVFQKHRQKGLGDDVGAAHHASKGRKQSQGDLGAFP